MSNIESKLADVRSTGSQSAVFHWILQRVTAILLIPLTLQLIVFLDLSLNSSYQDTVTWLQQPLSWSGLSLWILAVFYHAALGLQVVIEDYIGNLELQKISIKAINCSFFVLALSAVFLLFRIV